MLSYTQNFSIFSTQDDQTHRTGVQSVSDLGFKDDYGYNKFCDTKEEEARLYKEKWYFKEEAKLPAAMMTIVSVTNLRSPLLAGLIIEYMYPIHPDDMGDKILALNDNYESKEADQTEPHWSFKGFCDNESYLAAVNAATKKWHRTLSLAKRWGGDWRWKRHRKANSALLSLTRP